MPLFVLRVCVYVRRICFIYRIPAPPSVLRIIFGMFFVLVFIFYIFVVLLLFFFFLLFLELYICFFFVLGRSPTGMVTAYITGHG